MCIEVIVCNASVVFETQCTLPWHQQILLNDKDKVLTENCAPGAKSVIYDCLGNILLIKFVVSATVLIRQKVTKKTL